MNFKHDGEREARRALSDVTNANLNNYLKAQVNGIKIRIEEGGGEEI